MFELLFIAVIQGITEFLPISSSGHITIAGALFDIEYSLFMIIWLHASSLAAVITYYFKDLLLIARDFILLLLKQKNREGPLAIQLVGATAVTGVIGLFLKDFLENEISFTIVGLMLIATAGLIYLAESLRRYTRGGSFNWVHTGLVGIAHCISRIVSVGNNHHLLNWCWTGTKRSSQDIFFAFNSNYWRNTHTRIT